MKKIIFTLLLGCFTMLLSAEVYYLLPNSADKNSTEITDATTYLNDEGDFDPERNAYKWFCENYGTNKFITYKDLLDGNYTTDMKVLWINVDRHMANKEALDNLFPQDVRVRDAIANYVKAGGNVYLSTYAARLAHLIGRAPAPDVFSENQGFAGYAEWKVLADFSNNHVNHTHAIYKYLMENNLYNQKDNGLYFFHMLKGDPRSDRNCLWEMGTELNNVNNFQNTQTCKILGSWGHENHFTSAGLVEFYPKGDWKGTIIANGLAACSWASTNTDVHCVQHLTHGVLDYLNTMPTVYGAPKKFGYILPYSMQQMDSYTNENIFRPDYVAAKWFEENYVNKSIGCFLNPRDYNATNLIPQEVEVLWIHNDHVELTSDQYFTDLGRENFVAALREFVNRGGKVFLSKQATRLVGDLHLLGTNPTEGWYYYPSYPPADQMGYSDKGDHWGIKNTYTYDDKTIDYSSHPVYKGLSGYPVLQTNNPRTDNNYRIDEIALDGDKVTREDFIATEQQYQCRLLGCFSNNQEKHDGAIFAEFLPRTAGQGTVIMMGAAAYHWTGKEIGDINENLKTLTQNILEYLDTINTDIYTRKVTNGNYGTICLPRASKTITGATMWRVLKKVAEGVVIEQVSAMEAGVPYFFQATANQLTVEMQGATVAATSANGLVGYINVEGLKTLVPQGSKYYVLSNNELYFVNSDVYLPTNYAYVNVNEIADLAPMAGMPRRTMRLPQDENANTALENISTSAAPCKIIQNGQVYILRDGHIYTTLGTQVK